MSEGKVFAPVSDADVTRAILSSFTEMLERHVSNDVVVVGAGPSGLVCARELAARGRKVLLIERNNYLGGGFWIGGYLMNKLTVRHPAERILDELGVPYKEVSPGLMVADGPHACSKLIAAACDAGVKFANMTRFDDLVLREDGRVCGAVINWTPIAALPREITCVDPVAIECKMLIDATGHDAQVLMKLEERGLIKIKGFGAMWVERSEDMILEHTGEIHPGLVVTGMAVSTAYGLPRMGPTFGGMLMAGEIAAKVVLEKLG